MQPSATPTKSLKAPAGAADAPKSSPTAVLPTDTAGIDNPVPGKDGIQATQTMLPTLVSAGAARTEQPGGTWGYLGVLMLGIVSFLAIKRMSGALCTSQAKMRHRL